MGLTEFVVGSQVNGKIADMGITPDDFLAADRMTLLLYSTHYSSILL